MATQRSPETPIESTFTQFLSDKGKGEDNTTGNYRAESERELTRFLKWCRGETADPANATPADSWIGILPTGEAEGRRVQFTDLDATTFGDYARYLGASGFANPTQITYYSYVASWCGWAQKQGYINRHYARESAAEGPLPTDEQSKPGEQQTWSPEQRDLVVRYVNREAEKAIDAFGDITVPTEQRGNLEDDAVRKKARARYRAIKKCRDRALVYILAYTGLRVSEFLSDPDDDRDGRNGITWGDISFSDRNVRVYRKNRTGRTHLYQSRYSTLCNSINEFSIRQSRGASSRRSTAPHSLDT